jgi:hypothetical protein
MLSEGLKRELEMQRDLITRLREETAAKEARIRQLESLVAPRPTSRERLPPMEGFPGSMPPEIPSTNKLGKGDSRPPSAAIEVPPGIIEQEAMA